MSLEIAMVAAQTFVGSSPLAKLSFRSSLRALCLAAPVAAVLAIASPVAHAQARATASRPSELSAFGGFVYAAPDFGQVKDTGGSVGVDYTRFFGFRIHPSIEARGTYFTGDSITMQSLSGGFRGTYDFRERFHPYADVLVGGGVVKYNHYLGERPDRGYLLTYGIGMNVDVYKHFQVFAEGSLQNWNLGVDRSLKPDGNDLTYAPKILTVGISYRVPARDRAHVADNR